MSQLPTAQDILFNELMEISDLFRKERHSSCDKKFSTFCNSCGQNICDNCGIKTDFNCPIHGLEANK
jgi:hypothetical protein